MSTIEERIRQLEAEIAEKNRELADARETLKLMPREIRFRAWDNKNKVMILDRASFRNYGGAGIFLDHKESVRTFDSIITSVMQYTGICDRNGRDIYEDDIVEYKKGTVRSFVARIVWDKKRAAWGYRRKITTPEPIIDLFAEWHAPEYDLYPHLTVIGNVWENPELLDGTR